MALIAIYDSGVGGLSIFQSAADKCPEHDYLFISDNQAFPYGTKPEQELITRVRTVVARLDQHYLIDILIVACNTASTVVLPVLRDEFGFEVIGVVPAIKPAAETSLSKRICVLATPATVERPYTKQLVREFASDCTVSMIGSSDMVLLAEDKLYGRTLDLVKLAAILQPVVSDTEVDTLVLACTHFPLLRSEIESLFYTAKRNIKLVDSGDAIASRLSSLVETLILPNSKEPTRTAVVTSQDINDDFLAQLEKLGFGQLEHLEI